MNSQRLLFMFLALDQDGLHASYRKQASLTVNNAVISDFPTHAPRSSLSTNHGPLSRSSDVASPWARAVKVTGRCAASCDQFAASGHAARTRRGQLRNTSGAAVGADGDPHRAVPRAWLYN